MRVTTALEIEIDHLAGVRHDHWQDAHAEITPAGLIRLGTDASAEGTAERELAHGTARLIRR